VETNREQNPFRETLENKLRASLLSPVGWLIDTKNPQLYRIRTIIVEQADANCLQHHETGQCGSPQQVADVATSIFKAAFPNAYIRVFPERGRGESILLGVQIYKQTFDLIEERAAAQSRNVVRFSRVRENQNAGPGR
jgi:hypothetical protein